MTETTKMIKAIANDSKVRIDRIVANYEQLEKENTKLKTDYEVLSCSVGDFGELQDRLEEEQRKNNGLEEQLAKAEDLLKRCYKNYIYLEPLRSKIKQFLKESEQNESQ